MPEKYREPGGAKLNRSQTVTVRLDPRLNYLCDLAARTQRRTKSSFIEAVIDEAVNTISLDPRSRGEGYELTIGQRADKLWHIRPHERLIALAQLAPHLMTMEEQEIWALICESGTFWTGRWILYGDEEEKWDWNPETSQVLHDRVANAWDQIVELAEGELPREKAWFLGASRRPLKKPDLDDEIPF